MEKQKILQWLDDNKEIVTETASKIWQNPELAFEEFYASKLQAEILEKEGFKVTLGLKDMPTALVAEYGSGKPIIGILGEYDALDNLSQKISGKKEAVEEGAAGHGCGHNLLGSAGVGAVVALKKAMATGNLKGTIRYYGCPAEEPTAGKVFMAKLGVFDDLDACVTWHPAHSNVVWGCEFLSANSALFHFHGISAHGGSNPHQGRSALDAIELMNVGVNYLREHVDSRCRINYSIVHGTGAPNVIPAEATSWYYIRAPKRAYLEEVYERIINCAKGAALMTGTTVDVEFLSGCYDVLPNKVIGNIITENMLALGKPNYSEDDYALAEELSKPLPNDFKEQVMRGYFIEDDVLDKAINDEPRKNDDKGKTMTGCTDVGDVSYITPLAQFTTATWPVGVPAHSWQSTASSGSGIGLNAAVYAAKVMAATAYDLMTNEELLNSAKEEFKKEVKGREYKSPLPDGLLPKRK